MGKYHLQPTAGTEYLSLTLSDNLNWNDHMNEIVKRLTVVCCLVNSLVKVLLKFYYGYFHSVISDWIVFWRSSSETNRIFPQQQNIIRCMSEIYFMPPCRPIFKNLNILTNASDLIWELATVIKTGIIILMQTFQMSPYFISRETYNKITGISQFYRMSIGLKKPLRNLYSKHEQQRTSRTCEISFALWTSRVLGRKKNGDK